MSAVEASPNLRDFLSVKDDDVGAAGVGRRRGGDLAVLTTRAVLRGEKLRSPPPGRLAPIEPDPAGHHPQRRAERSRWPQQRHQQGQEELEVSQGQAPATARRRGLAVDWPGPGFGCPRR